MYFRVPGLLEPVYYKLLHQVGGRIPGTNIFSRDWDVCVILDACRKDLFEEVADEYDFVTSVGELFSRDSKTDPWTQKTFTAEYRAELQRTAYVTANPFSRLIPDPDDLELVDEVWRYAWDDDLGTVPPRPVTDRAIVTARKRDPERLLVHYLQPHVPFIPWNQRTALGKGNFGLAAESIEDTWMRLRNGDLSPEELWEGYRANLELVLDDVGVLLENIDAETVIITSDHGNGLGEWGVFGHPVHMPFRCVRIVPWVETTATDRGAHDSSEYDIASDDGTIEEKLQALGYR